jgi:UDP-N-acetylglucosamine 2-epimerase
VIFPAHPRTRSVLGEIPPNVEVLSPLGYLDMAALVSQARVLVTDSGGLQKEAYWYGVPCVTARPSTEWIDTVELGANVLVDDDPEKLAAAVASARMPDDLPPLYGDGHAANGSQLALPTVAEGAEYQVAVIGAGYVGVPLAATFAEAGCRVLLVDVVEDVVAALNRGESHILDVPSELLAPLVEKGLVTPRRATRSCATRTPS